MRVPMCVATTVISLFLVTAQPVPAQESAPMSLGDFKDMLVTYAELIGSDELESRYGGLTDEEWRAMYEAFPHKTIFAQLVKRMEERAAKAESSQLSTQPERLEQALTLPATEFTPRYPEGPLYDTFVATLPGLGLLSDGDLPGTQDDRCDDDGEADARIAFGIAEAAAIAGDVACNTIVVILGEGTNAPACIAAGVLHGLSLGTQIIIDQCGYQTALVDSAEIEAAYENTRQIIGTVNNVDTQLMTHDVAIRNQLTTHDTDVKALLATIQAIVTANGEKLDLLLARQLEEIRLLHTPQGRRQTDVPACAGGPCKWPNR